MSASEADFPFGANNPDNPNNEEQPDLPFDPPAKDAPDATKAAKAQQKPQEGRQDASEPQEGTTGAQDGSKGRKAPQRPRKRYSERSPFGFFLWTAIPKEDGTTSHESLKLKATTVKSARIEMRDVVNKNREKFEGGVFRLVHVIEEHTVKSTVVLKIV